MNHVVFGYVILSTGGALRSVLFSMVIRVEFLVGLVEVESTNGKIPFCKYNKLECQLVLLSGTGSSP